jgi:hypothetical protein
MLLAEWKGYLLVFFGSNVYLADSRAIFTNEDHAEYEWFYWSLGVDVTAVAVHDGVLYVGTDEGVYKFVDIEEVYEDLKRGNLSEGNAKVGFESYWVTPKDKFNAPQKLKTTNKRGCVAEATGDITVYVKTEKTDFEQVGTHVNVTDHIVSRIKRKKWKDIQLKFKSNTRFSLEQATLESFVGGYLKR